MRHVKILKATLFLATFCLFACQSGEVEVSYRLNAPVQMDLYAEGVFSTYDTLGTERVGTVTAAYNTVEFGNRHDTLTLKRSYQIDKSRGYLKNYMPSELALRVREVSLKALDRDVISVEGLEGYDSLVQSLPMPKVWQQQLLNPEYKKHLIRAEKHRWEMTHLLIGKVPEKGNITELLKKQGRLNFALIGIDSVVTEGYQRLNKQQCLTYTVYLSELESFPYFIWEQHVNSKIVSEEYQKYRNGLKGEYKTRYQVALNPNGGVLCQEREDKDGVHTMVNPETNDTLTFKSHVTLERLYTPKEEYSEQKETP